jgi:hypothetical protein
MMMMIPYEAAVQVRPHMPIVEIHNAIPCEAAGQAR